MTKFTQHTAETAPAESAEILTGAQKTMGFVPNLYSVLAESPPALKAYQALGDLFGATNLSKVEQNIVWLTINYENNCHYCVPAHTMIAKGAGVSDADIEALREGTPLTDPKLEALRSFTAKVTRQRGDLSEADTEAFLEAGYTTEHILAIIVGQAHKVISNYTNHFADTPVDAPFQKFAWTHPDKRSAAVA